MRNIFLYLISMLLSASSLSLDAQPIDKAGIPEKVMEQLYKRHPDAVDIVAEQKTHFKQELYAIAFKEGDTSQTEFFRPNGHFYVAGIPIESPQASDLLPTGSSANLTAAFTNYDIKKAVMVVNPNGSGEEFDFIINSAGGDWDVSMDRKGAIYYQQPR